ncbi:unnamed protein product [Cyprideis torosa]|uniref:Late endosomal/lysosomal adaptor and MAPK and MTOR activator 5 n=1 Tax=Cyprideis torosa TaxID=163714 RepID=A0A7R8WU58_9CRUS|nr:unnamed protein product [Cyprideis torosa]CAG0906312.1 unnamed protein product [Cyprideis torosa]
METTLERALDDAFAAPGVSGVACVSSSGFLIASRGHVPLEDPSYVVKVMKSAAELNPSSQDPPVVGLEGKGVTFLLSEKDGVTVIICKKKSIGSHINHGSSV